MTMETTLVNSLAATYSASVEERAPLFSSRYVPQKRVAIYMLVALFVLLGVGVR